MHQLAKLALNRSQYDSIIKAITPPAPRDCLYDTRDFEQFLPKSPLTKRCSSYSSTPSRFSTELGVVDEYDISAHSHLGRGGHLWLIHSASYFYFDNRKSWHTTPLHPSFLLLFDTLLHLYRASLLISALCTSPCRLCDQLWIISHLLPAHAGSSYPL